MSKNNSFKNWCHEIQKENQELLDDFAQWLEVKGLRQKTIEEHLFNVDFYINEYLLYHKTDRVEYGAVQINDFFENWFIRSAMWASEKSIKRTATGLKKFYTFLFEIGRVQIYDCQFLRDMIREHMPKWIEVFHKCALMEDDW